VHRKHLRATVGTADVDIPTGTFIADRFLYYNGIAIITVSALRGPSTATDNAVTRFDGTTGQLVQNSVVIIDDAGAVTGVTTLNTRDPARWVDGPAAGGSTDNAIARWDGTTGRLIQNSAVAIDDTGAVTGITSIGGVPVTDFVRGPTPAVAVDDHIATWDATSGRLIQDSGLHIGDVVRNFDAEAITNNIPKFFDGTGRRLTDSGIPAANVVQSAAVGVDNRLARYDGASRFIQSSTVTLDDSGNITSVTTLNGIDPSTWVQGPTTTGLDRAIALWDNSGVDGRLLMYSIVFVDSSGNITNVGTLNGTSPSSWVVGPNSATDNAVARFNLTTGKLVQNSVVIIDDSGQVTGVLTLNGIDPSTWVVGPASSIDKRMPYFSGTSGKLLAQVNYTYDGVVTTTIGDGLVANRIPIYTGIQNLNGTRIQDSGVVFSDLVFRSGSYTIGNLPKFVNSGSSTFIVDDSGVDAARVIRGGTGTDNAVVRYDTVTGSRFVQSSVVLIDDAGDVTGVTAINSIPIVNYAITSSTNHIGRVPVYNSGSSITESQVVISSGGVVSAVATLNGVDPATWVVGPASATDGRVAVYDGTTGKLLKNGTKLEADVVTGPSSTTDGLVAVFNGSTGKIVKSGTRQEAALVAGPAVATDNAIARYDATTGKLIQDSVVTIADSTGNISGAGTYNGVNVSAHASRHLRGGADPIVNSSVATGQVLVDAGSGNPLVGRTCEGFATRVNASVSTTDETIIALVMAQAGDYLLRVSCPYALADTSGSIVVSALFGGTGMVSVAIGQGQGRISTSGGTVSIATSSAPPSGVIFIDFLCTGLVASDVMYALVRKSTGTAMAIYKGTAILMNAAASP
jgi:hypothetical protein